MAAIKVWERLVWEGGRRIQTHTQNLHLCVDALWLHAYIHTHTCTYPIPHICTHAHTHTHVHTRTHTHACTYAHTHTHTHMSTGLMVTSAFLYHTVHFFNITIDIRNVCVFLAPLFSSLTTIVTYHLTKELKVKIT